MIREFFIRLKRCFSWFIFMWNNHDWDYNYLYEIIDKKLSDMYNHNKYYSHHISKNSTCRQIKICRWYLNKLINGPCEDLFDKFFNKFGEINFEISNKILREANYSNCKSKKENKYANKILHRIHRYETYLYKKYKSNLFSIMNRWINYWWD